MAPCSRPSTIKWSDLIYETYLGLQKSQIQLRSYLPPTDNIPDASGFQNAATALTNFSTVMAKHHELQISEKVDSDKKKTDESFQNLSEVHRNTFIRLTTKDGDDDETLEDRQPTEAIKTLLNNKIGIKAQAQLQHIFRQTEHICEHSIAMCTQIKNGTIPSHPSVNDINGISPFFIHDLSNEEQMSQDLSLRLEDQMKLGKISDTDMKAIIKFCYHIPQNFNSYLHHIRNFQRLAKIIAGPESIFALKLDELAKHARRNERCYREADGG